MAKSSWGSKASARPDGGSRWLRRINWTLALLILLACLAWFVIQPFLHPRTRLVLLTGDVVTVDPSPAEVPADYVVEDFRELLGLRDVLHQSAFDSTGPLVLGSLRDPDERSRLADQLHALGCGWRDVLIVYLAAHGLTQDGDAWLLAPGSDPTSPSGGRYRLAHVLAQLRECDAPVKLLLLEAGRLQYDPLRGLVENDFPERMAEQVRDLEDQSVWVLCSHSAGERSHLSPALRRSVFGYFVAEGLKGAADYNGDWSVNLSELSRFVSSGVTEWVRQTTGGASQQHPFLVRGGGGAPLSANPALAAVPKSADGEPYQLRPTDAVTDSRVSTEATGELAEEARRKLDQQIVQSLARVTPANRWGGKISYSARQAVYKLTSGKVAAPASTPESKAKSSEAEPPAATEAAVKAGPDADAKSPKPAPDPNASKTADSAPAAKSSATSNDAAGPSLPPEELLSRAWRLRDALADAERPTIRPVDYAPHLWRLSEARLLALDRRVRTGFVRADSEVADPLIDLVMTLEQLAAMTPAEQLEEQSLAWQFAVLRPGTAFSAETARSLALRELIAREGGAPMPADLTAVVQQLDEVIAGGSRADLEKLSEGLPADYDRYLELRTVRRVAQLPDLDWRLAQLLLQTSRLGEQAAAALLSAPSWVREQVETADRDRLLAERSVVSPTGFDREAVVSSLSRLRSQYLSAISDLAAVQKAERLASDVLHRLPHYLAWHAASGATNDGFAPLRPALRELIEHVGKLLAALRRPGPAMLAVVSDGLKRLETSRGTVERGLSPMAIQRLIDSPATPGSAWRINLLLESPLPSAESRFILQAAAPAVDAELASAVSPLISGSQASTDQVRAERLFPPRAELEFQLAEAVLAPTGSIDWQMLDRAWGAIRSPGGQNSLDETERRFATALQDLYRNLASRSERNVSETADLSSAVTRSERLETLLAWRDAQHLMLPGTLVSTGGTTVGRAVADARAYDVLLWARQRFLGTAEDAPPGDAHWLQSAAQAYRSAAAAIPRQPPVAEGMASPLEILGPLQVSLTYDSRADLNLTLHYAGPSGERAWILAEFDDSLIELGETTPTGVFQYRELFPHDGPAAATALHERLAKTRPSLTLISGRPTSIRLPITRLVAAQRATHLVVRVFTEHHIARHDVTIEMPRPEAIQWAIGGTASMWSARADGWTLHPFPNRSTTFALKLASGTEAEQTVDVQLILLEEPVDGVLPSVRLAAADGQRLRQSLSLGPVLAEAKGVSLSADGRSTPIVFVDPQPIKPPPAAEPAAGNGNAAAEEATALVGKNGGAPATNPIIEHGLLLVATDKKDQSEVFRQIMLAPQRPHRYVAPRVRYNLARERIEIRVSPVDPSLLPPDGVRLSADLAEQISPDAERQLDATLKPGGEAAEMYVEVAASPGRVATLRVTVDGFPRALLYRVPCSGDVADVPEDTDALAVRIAGLPEGTVYKPPVDSIPVQIEVDAPAAALGDPPLYVQVGLDRNRDRELIGDNVVVLSADREAVVTWSGLNKRGEWLLETKVGDFTVHVPALGIGSSRVNVIARAGLGEQVAWSAPWEIVLDDQPPRIASLELRPGRVVTIGANVEVAALGDARELSGIARVEAMFDLARSGKFGPESKPLLGAPGDDGRWTVKLPTAGLAGGTYNILVRAIDRAGNEGSPARTSVRLVTMEEVAAAERASNLADIEGVVVYGDAPQANIEVSLIKGDAPPPPPPAKGKAAATVPAMAKATTDSEGRFRFAKIPPGAYVVVAKGLVRNKNRTAEQEVKFQSPKELEPLTLELP